MNRNEHINSFHAVGDGYIHLTIIFMHEFDIQIGWEIHSHNENINSKKQSTWRMNKVIVFKWTKYLDISILLLITRNWIA